jgi:hypothetical protein
MSVALILFFTSASHRRVKSRYLFNQPLSLLFRLNFIPQCAVRECFLCRSACRDELWTLQIYPPCPAVQSCPLPVALIA